MPGSPAGRLAWRCRRGMKELDLLLTRWLRERAPQATAAQMQAFERFLELPDPQLAAYLWRGDDPEDPEFLELVRYLRGPAR
jgi:antitoxin CptB